MQLTEKQINTIAPDTASIKAATKVFNKTKWEVKKSDRAIWAAIQGSGKKPYLVQIDINDLAFKCSCPSRKFPCKHGLALAYYIAANGFDNISHTSEAIWVKEWIDKRTNKAITKAAKAKKVIDPKKQKKKSENKWANAKKSIEQVELWLKDLMKLGILDFPNKEQTYWAKLAKRMVDAKMPGINTYFNILANVNYQSNWEHIVLKIINKIHLLVQAIKNHSNLEADFKQELELLLGWNISKADLLANEKTEIFDDVWMIVKVDTNTTENLDSRKVHLYGVQTNRWAYILEFAFGNTYFKDRYAEGTLMQAKLAFYPGIQKTRAFVKIKGSQTNVEQNLKPIPNLLKSNKLFTNRINQFPWTFEVHQFIEKTNIIVRDNQYLLVDSQNNLMLIPSMNFEQYLSVLAHSQGHFFDAFVLRNSDGIRLLGFLFKNKLISV